MACKIYTVYIYMYKTCFLVKGEHSFHTQTHTHLSSCAVLATYTQQCAQTKRLDTFNTKI